MNIGLVAHDGKKKLMQNFCIAYRGILNKHELYATATTGRLIEEVTNLNVHKYLAGNLGGEHVGLALAAAKSIRDVIDKVVLGLASVREAGLERILAAHARVVEVRTAPFDGNEIPLAVVNDLRGRSYLRAAGSPFERDGYSVFARL